LTVKSKEKRVTQITNKNYKLIFNTRRATTVPIICFL